MKYNIVAAFLLYSLVYSQSYNFKFSKKNVEYKNALAYAQIIFEELKPLFEKPMFWCKIEPTGDYTLIDSSNDLTQISFEFNLKCDDSKERKLLSNIFKENIDFFRETNSANILDSLIGTISPDVELRWGINMAGKEYIKLYRKSEYGGSLGNYQSIALFNIAINNEPISNSIFQIKKDGSILSNFDCKACRKSRSEWYQLKVPTKILTDDFYLEALPVWHVSENQKVIEGSYY